MLKKLSIALLIVILVVAVFPISALADPTDDSASDPLKGIDISIGTTDNPDSMASSLQIIVLLTILALLPSLLIMMTGFVRILIVLGLTRNALGLQQTPPNQVIIGLALFLTLFIMGPALETIYEDAWQPYVNGEIGQEEAMELGMAPLRDFMVKQTYQSDLSMFMDIAQINSATTLDDIPTRVIIPAFLISELKRAFQIGFLIFLPFLIIDMLVASVLMSMGMMMLPPVMISMPLKIMIFVLAGGWQLVISTLVKSFA